MRIVEDGVRSFLIRGAHAPSRAADGASPEESLWRHSEVRLRSGGNERSKFVKARRLHQHARARALPSNGKDFAGAKGISVVHSLMTKWALWAVAGFLGCSLSASAQQFDLLALNESGRSAVSSGAALFGVPNSFYYGSPAVTLADGRPISLSNGYDRIEPMTLDFLPMMSVEVPARVRTTSRSLPDSDGKTIEVKPKLVDYVHGEVGVLYGTSAGSKYSREVEQGYILGEIGNDKYQINVGAFYEHSSAHFPRR
jgi:hypothetical protein